MHVRPHLGVAVDKVYALCIACGWERAPSDEEWPAPRLFGERVEQCREERASYAECDSAIHRKIRA